MNRVIHYRPIVRMPSLQREVDRMFERSFARPLFGEDGNAAWTPRVDISETEDAFTFVIDLPGLTKNDVAITYDDGVLSISGERPDAYAGSEHTLHRRERWIGRFARSFEFSTDIDAAKIKAQVKNGVLRIDIPKAESGKPVKINVS